MNLQKLKTKLFKKYKHKTELHAHTSPVSGCSQVTPQNMVETYKNLGYSAVAITNHFTYQENRDKNEYIDFYLNDFEQTAKIGKEQGLKVYLGAEIRFTENCNDYLIYGVDRKILEEIYDYLPYGLENFRKNYAMPNSIFIQAHPKRDGIETIDLSLLDGVEVYNMHPHHNSKIGLASLYAESGDKIIVTAGSDFHHPNHNHEGLSAIRTASLPEDTFALAKLLKSNDFLLQIGKDNIVLR